MALEEFSITQTLKEKKPFQFVLSFFSECGGGLFARARGDRWENFQKKEIYEEYKEENINSDSLCAAARSEGGIKVEL